MEYVVAFGANLGDREASYGRAVLALAELVGPALRRSGLFETAPLMDPDSPIIDQPNYLNAVLVVESHLDPRAVLHELLRIELAFGRERALRWAPRTIDLDLIAAEGLVISLPELSLPHPEMHKRLFVLEPMLEVAPSWVHPILGLNVQELLNEVRRTESKLSGTAASSPPGASE